MSDKLHAASQYFAYFWVLFVVVGISFQWSTPSSLSSPAFWQASGLSATVLLLSFFPCVHTFRASASLQKTACKPSFTSFGLPVQKSLFRQPFSSP